MNSSKYFRLLMSWRPPTVGDFLHAYSRVLLWELCIMKSFSCSLTEIQRRIDEVKRFLSMTQNIANAHTVEFYTHDVWNRFMAVPPQEVLSTFSSCSDQQRAPEHKGKGNSILCEHTISFNVKQNSTLGAILYEGFTSSNDQVYYGW